MNKSILGIAVLSIMLSENATAQTSFIKKNNNVVQKGWYNTIGFDRLDIETKNEEKFSGISMVKIGTGYSFNNYIGVELNALVPTTNKKTKTYDYSYYESITPLEDGTIEYGDFIETTLTNEIKPSYIADLSLVLNFPLSKNFRTFANIGYSHTRITYSYNNMQAIGLDNGLEEIINFIPVSQIANLEDFNLYTGCELFGSFEQCGYELVKSNDKYSYGGFSYGAGIAFDYNNNTSITLKYKNYSTKDDFKASSISVNYEWRW